MPFRWPFGKKQAAVESIEARREYREEPLDPYSIHIATARALVGTVAANVPLFPGALSDDTRGTIERHVEKELPILRPILKDLQGVGPQPGVRSAHQELLAGLQLAVVGQEQVRAAVRTQAQEPAARTYSQGLATMSEGVTMASSALARIDIILLDHRSQR